MTDRAEQILGAAQTLTGEAGGGNNDAALAFLLGTDTEDTRRVFTEALERGDKRQALSVAQGVRGAGLPRYRDLLMVLTGIELGVAAERTRGTG